MKKKKSLIWWILFGFISGFVLSIVLQLIFPNHRPFSCPFVIYHSFLCMAIGGIVGMFYDVTTDDNGNWYGGNYGNYHNRKSYHGGCYGCSRDGMSAKGYCKECQFYQADWSLPDKNDHKNDKIYR